MPTYEYKCTNCNYTFEFFQSMSSNPLTECPECKGVVKRLIGTGAGTIFKGSGFYQTDYKNNVKQKDSSEKTKKPVSDKQKPKESAPSKEKNKDTKE